MLFHMDGTITIDMIGGTVTVQLLEPVTIDGTINIGTMPPLVTSISSIPAITIADIVNLNVDSIPPIVITSIGGTVTIGGTIAISSIGGTVATSTTITNNPLQTSEVVIPRTVTQTTILVSNVSIVALAANANRKWVVFKNWSSATAAPIFIHFGASAATTSNGAPITADETWQPPPGNIDTQEIRVISSTASNKELYIEEWQ